MSTTGRVCLFMRYLLRDFNNQLWEQPPTASCNKSHWLMLHSYPGHIWFNDRLITVIETNAPLRINQSNNQITHRVMVNVGRQLGLFKIHQFTPPQAVLVWQNKYLWLAEFEITQICSERTFCYLVATFDTVRSYIII